MSLRIQGAVDNDVFPPTFGGAERVFSLYRALARAHQVRLLCVVPNRSRGAAREMAEGVVLERVKRAYTSVAWRFERLGVAPLFTAAYMHRAAQGSLARHLNAQADVWSVNSLNLASLLERRARALRVYLAQDVEVDFFRSAGPNVVARRHWERRLAGLEARALAAADLVVTVSAEDAARLAELYRLPPERFEVVENGYDDTRLRPPSEEERQAARARFGFGEGEHVGLFVGSDFPHNREAARCLVEDVYPGLARDGGYRLLVVGGVSASLGAPRASWLHVVPPVPDLLPYMHAADVGLNPVTSGGGSNVKLPAYLAAGLPVLTTRFGLRGYRDLAAHVTVAEPPEFTDAMRARPHRVGGRPALLARYAWTALGERLGRRYEALLGHAAAAAGGKGAP